MHIPTRLSLFYIDKRRIMLANNKAVFLINRSLVNNLNYQAARYCTFECE